MLQTTVNTKLTSFEKNLIRSINRNENKNFKFSQLQEWATDEDTIRRNLQSNERVYKAFGCFVAIKIS